MIRDFKDLLDQARKIPPRRVCVAAAEDEAVMAAVRDSASSGFIKPVLVGDAKKISEIGTRLYFDGYDVIDCPDTETTLRTAVTMVRNRDADILMKGFVNTSLYMRAILNRDYGLRTGRLLSLLAVYELPQYHKLIYASDSGINVVPDLKQKKTIMMNALETMHRLGIACPKTALLTANELPDPKIVSTMDAAALVEMSRQEGFPSCLAEGPVSFDIAFDKKAAEHKGVPSQIAGDVDLLIFPGIEAGNILGKSWLHFNHAKWAGIVLGASAPVILGSRSDTAEIKIHSIALACLAAAEK